MNELCIIFVFIVNWFFFHLFSAPTFIPLWHDQLETGGADMASSLRLNIGEAIPETSRPDASDQNGNTLSESADDDHKPSQTGGEDNLVLINKKGSLQS